jgi:hypothetical protein
LTLPSRKSSKGTKKQETNKPERKDDK